MLRNSKYYVIQNVTLFKLLRNSKNYIIQNVALFEMLRNSNFILVYYILSVFEFKTYYVT